VAHTNKNPTDPLNVPAFWSIVGATNRWRPFDKAMTPVTTIAGDFAYRLKVPVNKEVDTIHMFGLAAGSVRVQIFNADVSRRNLLRYSEDFSNAVHTFVGTGPLPLRILDPFGTTQARILVEDTSNGSHRIDLADVSYVSGAQYTFSAHVAAGPTGSRNVAVSLPAAAFPGTPSVGINPATGAIVSGPTDGTSTVSALLANGFYRVSITATADATGSEAGGRISILNGTTESYTGNLSSIRIFGAQTNTGGTPVLAYQWIADASNFGNLIYNEQADLINPLADSLTELQFLDLPAKAGDFIAIAVYANDGTARVGEIALSKSFRISDAALTTPSGVEIDDLSTYDENTFGFVNVIRRGVIKEFTYTTTIPRGDLARILDFVTFIRGVPVVWYDDTLPPSHGFVTYGRTSSAPVAVSNPVFVFFTIVVRSIT